MILTGWKEIAKHLRYGVRTVQRWEGKGLPVKHVNDGPRSPVVADSEELDAWILRRSSIPPEAPKDLTENLRRARELQLQINQSRKELAERVQVFRKGIAELRANRMKRLSKRDSGGVR